MSTGSPQGSLNHWRREADALPLPQTEGARCISPGGEFFQARAGLDEDGNAVLAWEVCDDLWNPSRIFFRPVPFPLTPDYFHA